jgi:hypothetical protein
MRPGSMMVKFTCVPLCAASRGVDPMRRSGQQLREPTHDVIAHQQRHEQHGLRAAREHRVVGACCANPTAAIFMLKLLSPARINRLLHVQDDK